MRVTLADLRASRIPAALGICATDSRLVAWLNEATERLLRKGKWWGTAPRFRICICNGCVTLPRAIAVIEAVAVCGRHVPIHDQWFEFLENGAGIQGSSRTCEPAADCVGHFPSFADICGTNKKVSLICDLASDVGKEVLVLGFDANGNWIRTTQNGLIRDGEVIALAQGAGTLSANLFSQVTDLQGPDGLDGQWWLYEYNTTDTTTRMIGAYQYDEIRPSYARYRIAGLIGNTSNAVDIIGKLDFIPVKNDSDYLILGNIPALKDMMTALKDAEMESSMTSRASIIAAGMALAVDSLESELSHYSGDGRKIGITIQGSHVDWGGVVENLL